MAIEHNQSQVALKTGIRLRSVVCSTEVIVVKAPQGEVELRCGGQLMVEHGGQAPSDVAIDPALSSGTLLGKRYFHEASALEVLCTKTGEGSLTANAEPLEIRAPRKLPSND